MKFRRAGGREIAMRGSVMPALSANVVLIAVVAVASSVPQKHRRTGRDGHPGFDYREQG
jgi:hypothetical protein